ncbi:MAG: DUF3999 family protein [Methylococcaceae bacterium]|nr:DUF3999 family protein [Methylococcaceae bacterium]
MLNNFRFLSYQLNSVLIAIVLALLLTPTAAAKEGFAFTATISSGKQSLRQFELPYEVLEGLQRQDYGDMRIFNSQNQSVPFTVKVIRPQTEQHHSEHKLDFFTLPRNPHRHSRLKIEIDKYNSRFSYSTTATTNSHQRSFIIIKNPYIDKGLHKLKLQWTAPNQAFSLRLKLEQSDDLERWQTLKNNSTLYDLKHGYTVLIKDTIFLPRQSKAKYLRLSFKNRNYFLHSVTAINGFYRHQSQPEPENWKTLTLEQGEMQREWLFNTGSVAPIAKIGFEIPQTGLFYQGTVFSKNTPLPPINRHITNKHQLKKEVKKILHPPRKQHKFWRYWQRFTQYRLITESGEINSEPFSLTGIKDSQWRIMLKQPLTLLPEQVPKINIAWYPVMVTFLAQGDEPYRLLFGDAKIKPLYANLPQTLEDNLPEMVKVSVVSVVEKTESETIPAETLTNWFKEMNWKKGLLWLLLCSGVLLMGTMAYKLYLGMNK